ncbi:MAG: hypothetical protein AB1543_06225 [Candidatus Bipolaricaulota bacterium]
MKTVDKSLVLPYIVRSLELGGGLAAHLLSLPLELGEVVATVPETTPQQDLLRFEVGGIVNGRETGHFLEELITKHLRIRGNRYVVFESDLSRRAPALSTAEEPYFFYRDETLYYVDANLASPESIRGVLRWARRWPLLGVLSSLAAAAPIEVRSEVDDELLKELAIRTEHLVVGAYDEEAVLVWSRKTA